MQGLHLLVPWRPAQRTTLRRGRTDISCRIGTKSIPRPGGHARPGDHDGPPQSISLTSIPRRGKRRPQGAGERGNSGARRSTKQS